MAIGFCLLAEKLAVVRPGVLSPVSTPLRSALVRPEAVVVEVEQYDNVVSLRLLLSIPKLH